jgi:hypothetical protein
MVNCFQLGRGDIAPSIHDLGTRWGWVANDTPLPGKGPAVPIGQEAGWAPEPVQTLYCLRYPSSQMTHIAEVISNDSEFQNTPENKIIMNLKTN